MKKVLKDEMIKARHRKAEDGWMGSKGKAQRHKGTEGEGLSGTIIEDALGTPSYDEVNVPYSYYYFKGDVSCLYIHIRLHNTSSEPNLTGVRCPE
ncbi:MAG TPA: hypothetical protein DDW17_03510 [Deltaproteobacteria bacterium]|nr:hypothetical protein [Deltaproteobacteria bacterium]